MPIVSSVIQRDETPCLYVRADSGPKGAPAAFEALEAALGGPQGRRFFGWLKDEAYRACVVRKDDDDPRALGLTEGTIPGGAYARALHDGPPHTIHETFKALHDQHPVDASRADLEDYRRHTEVYALLPIREA